MTTETAPYRVIREATDYELREYAPQLAAETIVGGDFDAAASVGFSRLAGYIFGKNKGQRTIAMTSPVTQRGVVIAMTTPVIQARADGRNGYLVRFTMPAALTRASLPEPLDGNISIVELPSRRVAAHGFSGMWSDRNFDTHRATLRAALVRDHLVAVGEPEVARYDPPWTLWFLRRNEILFDVAGAVGSVAEPRYAGAVSQTRGT